MGLFGGSKHKAPKISKTFRELKKGDLIYYVHTSEENLIHYNMIYNIKHTTDVWRFENVREFYCPISTCELDYMETHLHPTFKVATDPELLMQYIKNPKELKYFNEGTAEFTKEIEYF